MAKSDSATGQRGAPAADFGASAGDVSVVIELARAHGRQLARIDERLDLHCRQIDLLHRQLRYVDDELVRAAERGFEQVDDRFLQVEQRLDFIGSQLAEVLRRLAC